MLEIFSISLLVRLVVLVGALVLLAISTILVRRALHSRQDKVEARVSFIGPSMNATQAAPERLADAIDDARRDAELTSDQREFARRLRKFGISTRFAPAAFLAMRAWSTLCLAVGCWFLAPHIFAASSFLPVRTLLSGGAGALGWYLPAITARWAARRRGAVIVAGLPDALELLVICAEGGLALGDGIDRIVKELERSQPELAEELASTAADLKILPSQDQALTRLAARVDVPIVQSVVTTLVQTMRYGTPFAQAIRVMASEIRNDALIRLEKRANSLPTLMTIPMILLILPTILLIIGGPMALKVLDSFR